MNLNKKKMKPNYNKKIKIYSNRYFYENKVKIKGKRNIINLIKEQSIIKLIGNLINGKKNKKNLKVILTISA